MSLGSFSSTFMFQANEDSLGYDKSPKSQKTESWSSLLLCGDDCRCCNGIAYGIREAARMVLTDSRPAHRRSIFVNLAKPRR